jgi:trimethyllysine dioxygenase
MPARAVSAAVDAHDAAAGGSSVLRVSWSDGHSSSFPALWLRDHCPCAACRHPVSLQRQVDTAALDPHLALRSSYLASDGALVHVTFSPDAGGGGGGGGGGASSSSPTTVAPGAAESHASSFDAAWLRANCFDARARRERLASRRPRVPWGAELAATLPSAAVDYAAFVSRRGGDAGLRAAMGRLHDYGLVFLHGVPPTRAATRRLTRRIGFPRQTMYGVYWDTKPRAAAAVVDTAYTGSALFNHADGAYYRDPPGLQIFNCLVQAPQSPAPVRAGGERAAAAADGSNTYVDIARVAADLRRSDPDAFRFLSTTRGASCASCPSAACGCWCR